MCEQDDLDCGIANDCLSPWILLPSACWTRGQRILYAGATFEWSITPNGANTLQVERQ